MKDINAWESDWCPLCGLLRENTEHVIYCTDSRAYHQYVTSLEALSDWMETSNTNPEIQTVIISALSQLHHTGDPNISQLIHSSFVREAA